MFEPNLAGVPPARPGEPGRRGCVRYHYRGTCAARFVVRPSFRSDWAVLRDISASGAGLLLGHDPGPGAVLLLQLPSRGRGQVRTLLARVVRSEWQRDGSWLVGCRFSPPLSEEELALVCVG